MRKCFFCKKSEISGESNNYIKSVMYFDIDAFKDSLKGWDLDLNQLSPGKTKSFYDLYVDDQFDFLIFGHQQKSRYQAQFKREGITFFIPDIQTRVPFINGKRPDNYFVSATPSGHCLDGFTDRNFVGYTVRVSDELLRENMESQGLVDFYERKYAETSAVYRCEVHDVYQISLMFREIKKIIRGEINCECAQHERINFLFKMKIVPMLVSIMLKNMNAGDYSKNIAKSMHFFRAINIIDNNLDSPPKINELAESVGVTPRNLQYIFIEFIGLTPKAYIKYMQLNRVRKSFRSEDFRGKPVAHVADMHGFHHHGQFSQDFKKLFSVTPLKFSKQ